MPRIPAREGAARAGLRIYYLHPRMMGALPGWKGQFAPVQSMGFSEVCLGPVFAPGANGDIFLTDDFERAAPFLQPWGDADATVQELAIAAREAGLSLLLDIVLDRVAADGAMARSAPHWFYRTGASDVIDPRQAQLELDALPARFDEPQRTAELAA